MDDGLRGGSERKGVWSTGCTPAKRAPGASAAGTARSFARTGVRPGPRTSPPGAPRGPAPLRPFVGVTDKSVLGIGHADLVTPEDPAVTLRPGDGVDADVIARINVAAWRAGYRGVVADETLDEVSVERRALALPHALGRPGRRAWIAESGGEPVAYATLGPSRDPGAPAGTGELSALYVDPAQVSRGLGATLLARAEASLRELGYDRATLWVLAENARARRFYERMGWAPDGEARTYRWGERDLPIVRYGRELSGPRRQKGRT